MFIIAACNPQKGDGLFDLPITWHKPKYYVRALHPTLDFLKWDYGSLDETQETEYVNVKMRMVSENIFHGTKFEDLAHLIVQSQMKMREFAKQALAKSIDDRTAQISSKSCVSQRDIQRVFSFHTWLMKFYTRFNQHDKTTRAQRAVLVSLALVYYLRLDREFRKRYADFMDIKGMRIGSIKFRIALNHELDWFMSKMHIPPGIAGTTALKENIFAIIACCETQTPLIILGEPGTSKTLSFNLSIENLQGKESRSDTFKNTFFHSLEPFFYQCSRHTTSDEVENVFTNAIERQETYRRARLNACSVVFMDEAGLPEERHESLKVLHYFLDRKQVSFVAITNHALDAAKTNRAVCLYRPKTSPEDLNILAKSSAEMSLNEFEKHSIATFCVLFNEIMEDHNLKHFYGQRDFIHFVNYLRRNCIQNGITVQIMVEALERNLNGHEEFEIKIVKAFIEKVNLFHCFSNLYIHS